MRRYTFFPTLLLLAALISGCNPPTGDTRERIGRLAAGEQADQVTADDKSYQIVVIPQNSDQAFLQAVRQGCQDAAKKFNANIIWVPAAPADVEVARQKQAIEEAVAQKVDGIVLAPADATGLVIPVNRAAKARIPIAIFDADVNTKNKLALVAADDFQAGQLAARHIAEITGKRGAVGLIPAPPNRQSAIERERGFTDAIEKEFPQIKVIRSDDGTAERIFTQTPEMAAIFCPGQNATLDILEIVQDNKMTGKIPIIGFGSAPKLADALKAGELNALLAPDPYKMGYESVKAVVDHLQLREVPRRIDTGIALVTQENMNTPKTQKMLQ